MKIRYNRIQLDTTAVAVWRTNPSARAWAKDIADVRKQIIESARRNAKDPNILFVSSGGYMIVFERVEKQTTDVYVEFFVDSSVGLTTDWIDEEVS